jgi:branched-chain amino acid transport system substrate-binding protein
VRSTKSLAFLLALISALVLVVALPAVSSDAAGDCAVTIGVEAPLGGRVAVLGREQVAFARLAVQHDNEANGTDISLVQGDTQLNVSRAIRVTRQFISNSRIVAVVGPAGTQEVQAVGPLFARAGIGFITGSATSASLTTSGKNPTLFRVVARDNLQGTQDARYIVSHLKPKKLMIIDDQEAYSTDLVSTMISVFKKARIAVDHESVSQQQTNFARLVHKVMPPVGIVILPWVIADNAERFGRQLARAHRRAVLFGTDGTQSSAFTIPGSYVSAVGPDIRAIPADATIAAAAAKAYPNFGTFGPPVYAATQVVDDAIASVCKSGQTPSRGSVLAAIKATNEANSILGLPIRFDARGDMIGAKWFLFKIDRAHKYQMVTTPTR